MDDNTEVLPILEDSTSSSPEDSMVVEWWLYDEDIWSRWYLFRDTKHDGIDTGGIDVIEYRIMHSNTIEDLSCTLEPVPFKNAQMSPNLARDRWMELVGEGLRRLTDDVGIIKGHRGHSRWLTLNRVRENYKNNKTI